MALKQFVKSLFTTALRMLPQKPWIIFESVPDFSDNTFPVYEEMVRRKLHEKYPMVWVCSGKSKLPDAPKNLRYISTNDHSFKNKLRKLYYMAGAKCMISCNGYLVPCHKSQTAFFLSHGTPMKSVRNYYTIPDAIDYCLSAAPGVEEMIAYQFNVRKEKVFSLGYPRNDVLTQPPADVKKMLETSCKKVIVWYPTFRQHRNGLTAGSGKALPIIHNAEAALALNAYAKEMDVLLVLKPHFAQDLTEIKDLQLSNIRFIDDAFFSAHNTGSYAFVAGCDSLITDYSSIYFDYTLCDKPVGLVWEDVEEYRQNPGFAVDIDRYGKGGVKIYTLEDFKAFLYQVANDIDSCGDDRRMLRDTVNYAPDGRSTQRVTDFIVEKASL